VWEKKKKKKKKKGLPLRDCPPRCPYHRSGGEGNTPDKEEALITSGSGKNESKKPGNKDEPVIQEWGKGVGEWEGIIFNPLFSEVSNAKGVVLTGK